MLTQGTLLRPPPSQDGVTIDGSSFVGALAGDELRAALELMRTGANGAGYVGFGPLFAATAFEALFRDASALGLDSPEALQLLALCKEAAADPFALEAWLATL